MSTTQPEINAEIINQLSHMTHENQARFVLVGSLARGIILGHDILDLHDPKARRYKDVDAIDRSATRYAQYAFGEGQLDCQPTKSIRPVMGSVGVWGFYDINEPVSESTPPISTFDESTLGLTQKAFSRTHPDRTVTVPGPSAMLYLSGFFNYSHPMPKHQDQLAALRELSESPEPELDNAYNTYIDEMRRRYPHNAYGRARKLFFSLAPKLAMTVQETALGNVIRDLRGTQPPANRVLDADEL